MRELEKYIVLDNLQKAKQYLVPHVLSENYFNILKMRLQNKKLSETQRYYYNHFIKKKLQGMIELFSIKENIRGEEFILKGRLAKAASTLTKYARKHKHMKLLISGSFLYKEYHSDIDLFVISKYDKEDYREGNVHVNYLPANIEKTLFFKSIAGMSVSNFVFDAFNVDEEFSADDILHSYEVVVLLIMQHDDYLQELRDLIVRVEYLSNTVILNSMQLKTITDKITASKKPIALLNKYIIAKIVSIGDTATIKRVLKKFIAKNTIPEKGKKIYENWGIYNQTYKEALEVVT